MLDGAWSGPAVRDRRDRPLRGRLLEIEQGTIRVGELSEEGEQSELYLTAWTNDRDRRVRRAEINADGVLCQRTSIQL